MAVALILVAPTYVRCAGTGEDLAACLRSHIVETGVLPSPDQPQSIAEVDIPPAPEGTLKAEAADVVELAPIGATLAPTPGSIALGSHTGASLSTGAAVALAPLRGSVSAVPAPPPVIDVPAAMLTPSTPPPAVDIVETGTLEVSGSGTGAVVPSTSVSLGATPGQLVVVVEQGAPPRVPSANLTPSTGNVGLAATSMSVPLSVVNVAPTPGSLHLAASEPVGSGTPYIATLAAPAGLVTLSQSVPSATLPSPPVDLARVEAAPQPAGTLSAQGVAPSHSSDVATVALAADAALPPAGELIVAPPSKAPPPPATAVALTPAPTPPPEVPLLPIEPPAVEVVPPAATPPTRLLVEDPRYPSVILLPPPNTGDNSSIITLQPGG